MNTQLVEISGRAIELPMLIHVSRVRTHVASRNTWHSHTGFELLFLLEGATSYEFADGMTVQLRGGHFLVVPPKSVHRGSHDVRAPSTICGLAFETENARDWRNSCFTPRDIMRLKSALQKAGRRVHPFNPPLRWLVRRLMDDTGAFPSAAHLEDAAAALRTLICAVLVEATRQMLAPASEPREIVAAAIAYLRSNLESPLRIDDLVKHLGFSRARTFEIFKGQTGLTPNDYLQRARIERAQKLLKETADSVTDIALKSGFNSGQYFCTVFRRYAGISPVEFRKQSRTAA